MKIQKRNGKVQDFNPQKILKRIKQTAEGLSHVDSNLIFQKVIPLLQDWISSTEIDTHIARESHSLMTKHPEYGILGARVLLSRLYKNITDKDYIERTKHKLNQRTIDNLNEWGINYEKYKEKDINEKQYLAAYAFIEEYLLKDKKNILETPLELYSRVFANLASNKEEYEKWVSLVMDKKISMASPTLLNSGTHNSNMISCTSMSLKGDSREGIMETLNSCSKHSKNSAGLGVYVGEMRSEQSFYDNGRGKSSGLVKGIKLFEPVFDFFRQHENRKGAAAITSDIWHRDIEGFIKMKDPNTIHSKAAHNLFYSLSIPNLFYKRVIHDQDWSLFCPKDTRDYLGFNLSTKYGEEFDKYYEELEKSAIPRKTLKAKDLMLQVVTAQSASGVPYVFNRDNGNKNHNHNHLGAVKSQQLCNEYLAYHDEENEAQCDLASIPLPYHIKDGKVDFESLSEAVGEVVIILNEIIEKNDWNTEVAKKTGKNQRAIGIGIVGLAELALELNLPFYSEEFHNIQRDIQECIYYSAIKKSNELAKEKRFEQTDLISKSPLVTQGRFRFGFQAPKDSKMDWNFLQNNVKENGVVNSLFCCNMPTSSTSKLLSLTESFEAIQDVILKRKMVSGEILVVNKYFYDVLEKHNLLNDDIINKVIINKSVKNIGLPKEIENLFLNVYELGYENIINMAIKRQPYVDMGESMNLYYTEAKASDLTKALVKGALGGLTSGVYYTKIKKKTQNNEKLSIEISPTNKKPDNDVFECLGCTT